MADEKKVEVLPGAVYECLRCGTKTPGDALLKQPELTCPNCGYRLFKKVRGTTPKTLMAEQAPAAGRIFSGPARGRRLS